MLINVKVKGSAWFGTKCLWFRRQTCMSLWPALYCYSVQCRRRLDLPSNCVCIITTDSTTQSFRKSTRINGLSQLAVNQAWHYSVITAWWDGTHEGAASWSNSWSKCEWSIAANGNVCVLRPFTGTQTPRPRRHYMAYDDHEPTTEPCISRQVECLWRHCMQLTLLESLEKSFTFGKRSKVKTL